MTQPVQEPTTERNVQALNWRTAQLARRPPLSNAHSQNLAMAYITYDSHTVPTGLSWFGLETVADAYINPAGLATLPGAAAPHMTIDYVNGQIDFVSGGVESEPLRYGVYALSASAQFIATSWTGTMGLLIDINPSGQLPYFHDPVEFGDPSKIDTVPLADNLNVSFEAILIGNTFSFVGVAVMQDSGGDLDVNIAGLLMKQIGWYCPCEGEFLPS